ncbi:PQQ-dependent dehydrogenase, methanol/ethanol family [Xanthomonas hortorum]|uniref:PQQ-dependent dehydrogenase, methanol/ethanol family n=1 Tax=Xanthomonas hortorum TaxID=56454 RepID=UPI00131F3623|nr:PQQ-dependent dehydrogenase, methanol/ethanol family [Xanthomonas hortorum]
MRHFLGALVLVSLCACTPASSPEGGEATDTPDHDWPSYGLDHTESRFSPLNEINPETVKDLGLAWSVDLPSEARGLQATPLQVGGVLYFTASLSVVYALDAVTGETLWTYDPEAWKYSPRALRATVGSHRGVAYDDGAIFVGSSDGRLISLDAETGKVNWITNTWDEHDSRKQITGAPRTFNGKVIIGHGGADFGTRGYVTAYDQKTGEQVWRFWTVPRDPREGPQENAALEAALETWSGEWYKWGGGGTVWNAITFDPELNQIYLGTGNSANYNPSLRNPEGLDNLYVASIVALDADTGEYVWHYQVNPNEAWDFKATADIILADLDIDGQARKVLMQAPTNGFFYVIDRVTGRLLSAEKYAKATWAERIDLETGRPLEAPGIRYEDGPATFWPSPFGGHNWQAMSYSPATGLVYIPAMKMAATYFATPEDIADAEQTVLGTDRYWFPIGMSIAGRPIDEDDGTGELLAWDPVHQEARWSVKRRYMWNGGTLVTASNLVFQGTADGWFYAHDASNGDELWRFNVKNGVIAPPITYEVNGVQYVTLLVGYGGSVAVGGPLLDPGWRYRTHPPRVLTFKVGGKTPMPATPEPDYAVSPIDDPQLPIDEQSASRGERFYNRTCAWCHGPGGHGAGAVSPDLRESSAAHDYDALRTILIDGVLVSRGMPQFNEISDREVRDLQMHIRSFSRAAAQEARPE